MATPLAIEEHGNNRTRHQFGAFDGVFTPAILTILGAIMFMRTGFVVGTSGIQSALFILILANSITFLTGLSISGIATNTRIHGGGAYFMISRVLGPEFGGAIGLALFFGQALSVPFYIIAFVEALKTSFPALEGYSFFVTMGTATALFLLVLVGAKWAIKAQFLILAVLAAAVVGFIGGGLMKFETATFAANWKATPDFKFWVLFAVYFPAITGIMAGVNMSGDLKNPGRAIPKGTLGAIGVGFLVYAIQMIVCGGAQDRSTLINKPYESLVSQCLFGLGFVVMLGVFAATLSSAIGSFLGAPRVLQALARDRIIQPLRFFATGSNKGDEPRRALLVTLAITFVVLAYAESGTLAGTDALNVVARVVSMFFLYTYGMTNLAAFVESFGLNPSFRPRFRHFHWVTALAGAIGCGAAAFRIHASAALVALVILVALYFYVRSRVLETAFGDARRGFFYSRVRTNLLKLAKLPPHPKNWRPTVLALTGNPASRATLAGFANWIECGRGIVTLAEILVGDFESLFDRRDAELQRLQKTINEQGLSAFPEVMIAANFDEGLTALLQVHSIGPLKANLVLFGWPKDPERVKPFVRHLRSSWTIGMSLVSVIDHGLPTQGGSRRIDIWWRGLQNGSLMLLIAHLLRLNWQWARARIRILRVVRNEQGREPATLGLTELVDAARIEARVEVVVSQDSFKEVLQTHSSDAAVVLLGFVLPEISDAATFGATYSEMTSGLPTTLLVSSTGDADLLA
jgi:amino acid transporter